MCPRSGLPSASNYSGIGSVTCTSQVLPPVLIPPVRIRMSAEDVASLDGNVSIRHLKEFCNKVVLTMPLLACLLALVVSLVIRHVPLRE